MKLRKKKERLLDWIKKIAGKVEQDRKGCTKVLRSRGIAASDKQT